MNRTVVIRLLVASVFGLVCQWSATAKPPNIVFILVDDLGWSDLGCQGHPYHQTPHIDRIAAEGIQMTNGYSPAPICSASRASILTGKAVPRVGFEFVTKSKPGQQVVDVAVPLSTPPLTLNLPLSHDTIAEQLTPLGYETAFFGKWHVSQHYEDRYLAWHPKYGPRAQGFDVAVEDFGDHPYAWKKRKEPEPAPENVIPPDSMINRVADFIRSPHEGPFFVMASSFYVHTPVKNRTKWLVQQYEDHISADSPNRRKRLEYAAFVHTLDHQIGKILDAIDDTSHRDDTLVVFLSDNGGHPEFCSNAPLRGSKWNLYEGGIRVPFLARWPGHIMPASTSDVPVIGYDLLPTFVEVAGGKTNDAAVDGISLLSVFAGESNAERSLIWHFPYYHPETKFADAQTTIGVDDFAVSRTRPQSAIRRGRYKMIRFAEDERVELYDLQNDPSEQVNLRQQMPEVTQRMRTLLDQQLTEMNARRAVPHLR